MESKLLIEKLDNNLDNLNDITPNNIIPYESNKNIRASSFIYNNEKIDILVSLYSNAIFIIASNNAKLSNIFMYDLDDNEKEEEPFLDEEDLKEVKISKCLFGDRRNETLHFIINLIITALSDKIQKFNDKIKKIILSVNIPLLNSNNKVYSLDNDTKLFIDKLKENILQIFN